MKLKSYRNRLSNKAFDPERSRLIGDILRASKRLDIGGIRGFGIMEIIPHPRWKDIDPFDPDLDRDGKSGEKAMEKTKKKD